MAVILNIETSAKICSVAISEEGQVVYDVKDSSEMNHASALAPAIKKSLEYLKRQYKKLDAVSVSIGPGSYTGLRIGLSMAKGICFGDSIPLIGISTLKILATKAMFSYSDWEGYEIIVPMIDARRMEVFAGGFDSNLNEIVKERPVILDEKSFDELFGREKVIFAGDGSEKFKEVYGGKNGIWIGPEMPDATDMAPLSELNYRKGNFIDIAYSVPSYLKEYQTTVSKNRI